ncbi:MAG: 50S ribosomal protein L25 [Candidatus Woesearchaeota archaeon]
MKLEKRTQKPNKLRREGFVPGVIYGKDIESTPVKVEYKKLLENYKEYESSKVFNVTLGKKKHQVYFKDLTQNPLKPNEIEHFGLLKVSATDTISTEVPINVEGKHSIEQQDLIVQLIEHEIEVEFNPGKGITQIDVDVTGMEVNDSIHVKDLQVPEGVKINEDPENLVLNIAYPELEKDTTPDTEMEEPEVVGEDEEGEESEESEDNEKSSDDEDEKKDEN